MIQVTLPHGFKCRDYQLSMWRALESGVKRAVWVCHRRAGKDITIFNWLIQELVQRKQTAYYILPTYSQAKKIIWEGMTRDGTRILDFIPRILIYKKSESELSIRFINGSLLQLIGSENYDRIVGTNPAICIFSEMALQNPTAWDYIRPILAENGGRAVFISTPRGHNHFWDLYNVAQTEPGWFFEKIDVKKSGVISLEDIEHERRSGMSDDMIQQEFFCSFEVGQLGSYYGKCLTDAYDSHRVCHLPYDPNLQVYTAWDIGFSDSTSIIFYQLHGKEIHVIDHYENHGYAFSHYLDHMRKTGYSYGTHYLPHDGKNRSISTGKSLLQLASETEFKFDVVPEDLTILAGIERVRGAFPNIWFDKAKCEYLLRCLQQYHADFDDNSKVFKSIPRHDWSSHAADAFRYMVIASRQSTSTGMTADDADNLERKYRNLYY